MPQREHEAVFKALQTFAASVQAKLNAVTKGEPEDQLRAPFESLMVEIGQILSRDIVCTGETLLKDRIGKPDYAIEASQLLAGYVELKAPGVGAKTSRFKGHNRRQSERFKVIPNLLYCDGNEWGLYRTGEPIRSVVSLAGDIAQEGANAVEPNDGQAVLEILTDFLAWQPSIPITKKSGVDLKGLAEILAPLCRMLRDDVIEALGHADSPLVSLAADWRKLLFPEATDEQFADSYAQTVTFALLLARSEGAEPLSLDSAEQALSAEHSLLSRALQVLTDPKAQAEISASLNLLVRVIGAVPSLAMQGKEDPWLYFYEDFLAEYDPELRKNIGAYYTPVEVVRAQVRLIDDLLTHRLHRPLGFADPGVVTLDPAVGTGTYLLGVIQHALAKVEREQGAGAVAGQASALATNLYGFEILVGPYSVSELRISRALEDRGATMPTKGMQIYLTDTLESPNTPPPALPFYLQPIADQHKQALKVKENVPVMVCLGNPPYDRHEAADETNRATTGGWVRWGDDQTSTPILSDFIEPAREAGHGTHLKNLYNLYVYFWRWALWKVFEQGEGQGPGIISFITASSFLDGDAFCGMREQMRRQCDEIWILDLGGEGRGTRKTENVFDIQTPVAIAVCVRYGEVNTSSPATARYIEIEGSREEKLEHLDGITDLDSRDWQECSQDWSAAFMPEGEGVYFEWPLVIDLFPWQHSGVKAGRTWVIAPDASTLERRWKELCQAEVSARSKLFKDSPTGKKSDEFSVQLPPADERLKPITDIAQDEPTPVISAYAYRSFDRQRILADGRMIDRASPDMWRVYSESQSYLTTLLNHPLGDGPAVTATSCIPDLHHFRGSYGAKEIIPLFRDAECNEPNIRPGLLAALSEVYGKVVATEDFFAYVYALLAQPAFTERFRKELGSRELRVPLTAEAKLFDEAKKLGSKLLWLHTYGERYVPKNHTRGQVPQGKARCTKGVSGTAEDYPEQFEYNEATQTLHVGDGEFAPVTSEVFDFNVSGLKVVQS